LDKENTPGDSIILSWWDYGYWINRMGQRKAYVDPSQNKELVANTANMLLMDEELDIDYLVIDFDMVTAKLWALAKWIDKEPTDYMNTYYITDGGNTTPVVLYTTEYYQTLVSRLYSHNGKSVISSQSSVIKTNGRHVESIDTYATYEEALRSIGIGQRIVGTAPFVSPVDLKAVSSYELVYESKANRYGIPEVKIFKKGE
jgi:asparagine N-glycosylation enzyme membrane subunit Stt3